MLAAPKEDWRSAAALIAALGREGDVIYLLHYGGQLALDRYLPPGLPRQGLPAAFDWQRGYTAPYRLPADDLETLVAPQLAGRRRAWVVLSHADGRGDQPAPRLLRRPLPRHAAAGLLRYPPPPVGAAARAVGAGARDYEQVPSGGAVRNGGEAAGGPRAGATLTAPTTCRLLAGAARRCTDRLARRLRPMDQGHGSGPTQTCEAATLSGII